MQEHLRQARPAQAKPAVGTRGKSVAHPKNAAILQLKQAANEQVRQPLQLVKDEGLRSGHDVEVDALKVRTVLLLDQLKVSGDNWAGQWGEKAREKARTTVSDKLEGKESEPIEKQVLRKLWKEVPPEDKREIAIKATTAGVRIFGEVVKESSFSLPSISLPSFFGGSSNKKDKEPEQEESSSSGVTGAVVEVLGEITLEDAKNAYALIRKYKDYRNKVDETKKSIVDAAGNLGEKAGEFAGTFRDDNQFEKLISAHFDEFLGARTAFVDLERRIQANEDRERYDDELNALHNTFRPITGPYLAFFLNGGLSAEARLKYPEICREARTGIATARRDRGAVEMIGMAFDWVASKLTGSSDDPSDVPIAQEKLASAIRTLIRQDWSKVTYVWGATSGMRKLLGSTPDGVKNLQKIDQKLNGKDYLDQVVLKAARISKTGKHRNKDVTQPFYDAIKDLEVGNSTSLKNTLSAVKSAQSNLTG